MMTDISNYLDFIMKLFLAFGLAFEVPVVTIMLTYTGLVSVKTLKHYRPYIIVGAFTIGMLLTPPDVISQVMLALPMWFLFELGVIASRIFLKKRLAAREQSNEEDKEMTEEDMNAEFNKAIEEEAKLNKQDSG